MPTYFEPLLPNASGLALGSAPQSWALFASTVSLNTLISLSNNPATAGVIRLANADTIQWRTFSNSSNVGLYQTGAAVGNLPSDCLSYNGNGICAPAIISFATTVSTQASTGALRLSNTDVINWRNITNSGNLGISVNNNNQFVIDPLATTTVIGTPGIVVSGNGASGVTLNSTAIAGGSGVVSISSGNASSGAAGSVNIAAGNSGGAATAGPNVTLTAGNGTGAAGGSIILNTGSGSVSGTLQTNTTISKYGNIATVGNGIPSEYATIDLTGQTAAIGTTTIYSVPASGAGQYRISWNAKITTAGSVSSTLGALTIVYTDPDGVVVTVTAGAQITAGTIATTSTANTTGTVLLGLPILMNCKAATNITYAMAYAANAGASMAYNLHIKLEYMG